jgi:Mg-chelatase subunit ChlD
MPQTVKLASESDAIKALFKNLLPDIDPATYSLGLSDKPPRSLTVNADDALIREIKQRLTELFRHPEQLRHAFSMNVQHRTSPNRIMPDIKGELPQPIADSFPNAKTIFTRVFPDHFGGGIHFNLDEIFAQKNGAECQSGVLYSIPESASFTTQMWELYVQQLLKHFNQVPVETIRKAWSGLEEMPNRAALNDKLTTAKGIILECLGTIDDTKANTKRIFFNYRRLYQSLYPPVFENTLDMEHLTVYFRQVMNEGFLMTEVNEKSNELNPFFFESSELRPKPVFLNYLIDTSGSMEGYERDCHAAVKKVVARMQTELSETQQVNAKLQFTRFATRVNQDAIHNFSSSDLAVRELEKNFTYASDYTALYDAMSQALAAAANRKHCHNVIVVFTDGLDNESKKATRQSIIGQIKEVQDKLQHGELTILAVGLGRSVDMVLLEKIATATDGYAFNIDKLDQMASNLIDNIRRMAYETRRVTFSVNAEEYRIPVPKNGSITQAKINVPFVGKPLSITVDGDDFIVRKNILAAKQTVTGRARMFACKQATEEGAQSRAAFTPQ